MQPPVRGPLFFVFYLRKGGGREGDATFLEGGHISTQIFNNNPRTPYPNSIPTYPNISSKSPSKKLQPRPGDRKQREGKHRGACETKREREAHRFLLLLWFRLVCVDWICLGWPGLGLGSFVGVTWQLYISPHSSFSSQTRREESTWGR